MHPITQLLIQKRIRHVGGIFGADSGRLCLQTNENLENREMIKLDKCKATPGTIGLGNSSY